MSATVGAGAQRERDAVAGRHRAGWSSARRPGRARRSPARRRAPGHGADAVLAALAHDVQREPAAAPSAVEQQVERERVLDDLDARVAPAPRRRGRARPRRRSRRRRRARSGCGGGRPRGSATSEPSASWSNAGAARDQPADGAGPLGDQDAHRVGVAQADAGDERVVRGAARGCRPRRARPRCRPGPSGWSRPRAAPW